MEVLTKASSITQDMRYRQSFCIYAQKYGVTKSGIKYEHSKQYIAYWLKRYDGTIKSLEKRSRRPHSHPMQHTEQEIRLITDMRRRSPDVGLIDFWSSLLDRGYTRTIAGLYRQMVRMGYFKQRKKKDNHESVVMEAMTFPEEKVQIDVKVVPKKCISNEYGDKYYQYTMIDEFSRMRYLRGYKEQNAYSTTDCLEHAIRYFHRYGIDIKCVQTDNGREFTNRFDKRATLTMFQIKMQELGIKHKTIRPYTPRHNGKVERSHREDQRLFYDKHKFMSLEDLNIQLRQHNQFTNNRRMRPLGYKRPMQYLKETWIGIPTKKRGYSR